MSTQKEKSWPFQIVKPACCPLTNMLSIIEKLYSLRTYALSRRFILLTAVIATIVISGFIGLDKVAPNYTPLAALVALIVAFACWYSGACFLPHEKRWLRHIAELIDQCEFGLADRKLTTPPWLAGFALRIKRLETLANLKLEIGDFVAANSFLAIAEAQTLLPDERKSIQLSKANLLFQVGNFSAFRKLLDGCSRVDNESKQIHFRYLLLMSRQHELDGNYRDAKALLEEATEITSDSQNNIIATNNLARLEDAQGNYTNAQNYYERSWYLLQKKPVPRLYPIVIHNLLLKYSRNGNKLCAIKLLDDYRAVVSLENIHQHNQLLNDQIHLARQLEDHALLQDAYNRSETQLKPLLNSQQLLAFAVSGLRMHLNDGIGFALHLDKTLKMLQEHEDLSLPERFLSLNELLAVLDQYNKTQTDEKLNETACLIIKDLLEMESGTDLILRDISPTLPAVRDTFYGYKIQICKLKIRQDKGASRSAFDDLFWLLQERRRVWSDKGNAEGEIKALVILCDEYVAYARSLNPQFADDYRAIAEQALADAGKLLESQWPHPSMHQYALGISWFFWQIANDKPNAAQWLIQFEKTNFNIAHYAVWLRVQYSEVKEWLTLFPGDTKQSTPLKL